MKKMKLICIVVSFFLAFNIPFSMSAASYYPTIITPIVYDEVPYRDNVTVTWSAPTAGTVTKYLISFCHLKYKDYVIDDLMVYQEEVPATARSYTFSHEMIMESSFFRVSLGAVNSNGSIYWAERLFYVSSNRGVHNRTISLKIFNDFPVYFKDAIYYSTRTWIDATGLEKVNTYSYSNGFASNDLLSGDGVSTVVPGHDYTSDDLMRTYSQLDSSKNLIEADIMILYGNDWDFGNGAGTYDVQNVMTHEIGHVWGLCDKYESFASEWTMFGYTGLNETKKRTLSSSDLQSLTRLYD